MAGAAHGDFHVSHTGVELSKTLRRATSKVVPHICSCTLATWHADQQNWMQGPGVYGTLVHGRRKDEEAM